MTRPRGRSFTCVVIGGGPSGAVASIRLAHLGHAVCLVDRGQTPRESEAVESMTPSVLTLADQVGLRGVFDLEGFPCIARTVVRWGGDEYSSALPPGEEP